MFYKYFLPLCGFPFYFFRFSSFTQSCLTLCDPINCSTPGFSALYQLLELAQTHGHWVGDAIQLPQPFLPLPTIFPSIRVFSNEFFTSGAKVLELQLQHQSFQWIFRTDFLYLTGLILLSKGLSRVFSYTTDQSINSSVLSFLYGPTLTSIHDY